MNMLLRQRFVLKPLMFAFLFAAAAAYGETWELKASNAFGTIAWQDMQYWKSVEGGTNGLAGVAPSASDDFIVHGLVNLCHSRPRLSTNVYKLLIKCKYVQGKDVQTWLFEH